MRAVDLSERFVSVSQMVSKRFARLIKILSGAAANAEDEIFVLENRAERFVHFWVLVVRQFVRHRCLVRASALSYATLIALIPLLAVALSLTSSLLKTQEKEKFQGAVEKFIASVTPPATVDATVFTVNTNSLTVTESNAVPALTTDGETNAMATATHSVPAEETRIVTVTAQKQIANYVWGFVQNTQSAALGATGVVFLVFIAISLLGRVEETFNDIWGVQRGRNWLTQIQLYSTTIILGPLLLLAAMSLAGGGHFHSARELISQMPVIGKLIFQLLPLMVLWLAFTLIYLLLPNTKVNFSAAAVGGAVAGILWFLNNIFGFLYVSRVVTNSKIYGSLGLVPVFMIGLYFSWVFLLLGAQIAYAFQNRVAYLQDRLADNINQRGREFVALRIMTSLGQRFQRGQPPATVSRLSAELGVPSRLTQSVLRTLTTARLVTETAGAESAYVPARPLETINAYDILLALRTANGQELQLRDEPALNEIYGEFSRIEKAERETASVISLLALANRVPARAELAAPEMSSLAISPVLPEPAAALKPETLLTETAPAQRRRDVVRPDESGEFPL
jgi:membrane protein